MSTPLKIEWPVSRWTHAHPVFHYLHKYTNTRSYQPSKLVLAVIGLAGGYGRCWHLLLSILLGNTVQVTKFQAQKNHSGEWLKILDIYCFMIFRCKMFNRTSMVILISYAPSKFHLRDVDRHNNSYHPFASFRLVHKSLIRRRGFAKYHSPPHYSKFYLETH